MPTINYSMPTRGLYAVTPEPSSSSLTLISQVEYALLGGASLVQYRDKQTTGSQRLHTAQALLQLCRSYRVPLIINDDLDLAVAIGADGVHLGQYDPDPILARRRLGPQALIGVSCYNHLHVAQAAQAAGANYVAFGRFFASKTKPLATAAEINLLRVAKNTIRLPLVAIGGITLDNGQALITAGADILAVISALFDGTGENIQATAKSFTTFW